MWPGVLTDWIGDDDVTGRATASMLLARVGSTRPWHVIALDLGLPADFAAAPPALIRTLRRNGTWTGLLTALDTLATRLEQSPPPIDYSARRWAAADLTNMADAIRYVRDRHP